MLKVFFPAKVLPARVLHPTPDNHFIGQTVGVLQAMQPRHQPDRRARPTLLGAQRTKLSH
jgi:hypothetical protein